MRRRFGPTLYNHIIVKYNVCNHDFMQETHECFFGFLEFTSLNMRNPK